jgi:hypothetical protein
LCVRQHDAWAFPVKGPGKEGKKKKGGGHGVEKVDLPIIPPKELAYAKKLVRPSTVEGHHRGLTGFPHTCTLL